MEATEETIAIEAPGGTMSAFVARPARRGPATLGPAEGYPGVLVIMEAFGLNDHVRSVCRRLSGEGYVALAPDLYYREGKIELAYDDLDRAVDLVMRTIALSDAAEERVKDDRVVADLAVALDALQARGDTDESRLATVGFCMGGRLAFLLACRRPGDLSAAVSFSGGRIVPIVEESKTLAAPLLLLFGDRDTNIPLPQIDRIRAELEFRAKAHHIEVYPGAGHGFFCEERPGYDPTAAADAWKRTLGWLGQHLGSAG